MLLAAALLFSLGGCTVKSGTIEKSKLIVATNAAFPPYAYKEDDEIIGIDAEIAARLADKLGLELVLNNMAFETIAYAVGNGKADMGIAGIAVTDEWLESTNFTTSYATNIQAVIVTEDSPITNVDDLLGGGLTIGVQANTPGDLYTTWDLEDESLATISRYSTSRDTIAALTTGMVDCVVIDNEPAKAYSAANTGLRLLDEPYATEDYAIAVAKGNDLLLDELNAALQELMADGTVQSIIDKYIGQ